MWRIATLTLAAMLAFAGNSIICRLALADAAIEPAGFTVIRLAAGAATLSLIAWSRGGRALLSHGSWAAALALFIYAAGFSYAYVSLSAASGALILFGFVQATMIAAALRRGDRPALPEWLGWLLAAGGLVWLLAPGTAAPSWQGAALMATAGIAWGAYSLLGRGESRPMLATTANFVRALAPTALLLVAAGARHSEPAGIALAVLSGSLTSGLGYVIWYAALPGLSSMQAALVQLSVPAIAAAGGLVLLGEGLTPRLLVSGGLILGGIAVALTGKYRKI